MEEQKNQNTLNYQASMELIGLLNISDPNSTESTLKPIVDYIFHLLNVDNRPCTVNYFRDEYEEEVKCWVIDITWSNTDKRKHDWDWLAILVYHNGIQIGTEKRRTHRWIPYTPEWQNELTSNILPHFGLKPIKFPQN